MKALSCYCFRSTDISGCRSRNHQVGFIGLSQPALTYRSSVATTWALFALTKCPDVQEKLRAELLNVPTDNPTMNQLNALPYLDAVVRETMRLHPPVPSTLRVANQDDVIPLEKPVTDEKGNIHEYIRSVCFCILTFMLTHKLHQG